MRHFLTLQDLSRSEILMLIDSTSLLKKVKGVKLEILKGKSMAMIFEKPSTRTRVSFELAMKQLGGEAIYLETKTLQVSRGETLEDTARVLSRYVDLIMARVHKHESLEVMAKHSSIPVINGLSDMFHPAQILSDLFTIKEKLGRLENVKIAYIGDGNNVCNSLLIGCTKLGLNISVACPSRYAPASKIINLAVKNAEKSGSIVEITADPFKAVKGADIIYTDTFVSMGMESEYEERIKTFLPKYQVNEDLINATGKNTLFMHCLPAHRGEEVTDEVIDGPWSIVWDQAENRLHAQKSIILWLLGRMNRLKAYMEETKR